MSKKKKIVCLGGGNAMPNAVLCGLKNCDVEIFSVSSMNDSGGSAGEEREFYGTPVAYGDIRRAAYQLSGAPYSVKERLNKRLETEEEIERARRDYPVIDRIVSKDPKRFKGHVLSNIISTATDVSSGTIKAIQSVNKLFEIPKEYKILPVTISNLTLVAELENGERIIGETNIDKYRGNSKVKRVFFDGNPEIYPETSKALEGADFIVIGPGDLYSSIAQILLVKGVSEAIKKGKAKKIYVCNLMRKQGETTDFKVLDFVEEIENYSGFKLDFMIYNTGEPSEERLKEYRVEHPELIGMVIPGENLAGNGKFIGENLLVSSGPIIHDSKKVVKTILNLCRR